MRRFNVVSALMESSGELTPEQVMEAMVEVDGARTASWLVASHRRQFHRYGAVDFKIPRDKETPSWIRVAFEKLRASENWAVTMSANPASGTRVYRVRWLRWGYQRAMRPRPVVMR